MKTYVYKKVSFGRIPKRHQPVGWHLYEQNLFVYFFKLRSYRQKDRKISSNITKKLKENKFSLFWCCKKNYSKENETYHNILIINSLSEICMSLKLRKKTNSMIHW